MNYTKHIYWIILLGLSLVQSLQAQTNGTIRGRLIDASDSTELMGASLILVNKADTTRKLFNAADMEGSFQYRNVAPGQYTLSVNAFGYKPMNIPVNMGTEDVDLGTVSISTDIIRMQEVVIGGELHSMQQKEDTTVYNADAFKTNPDATVEDLVKKMPGITIENGTVKAQGEEVKRVTIDGREFFGEDAAMALRNLPAEVVDKIQVFDRLSDQARFTGFDDGNTQKAINIVTKNGMTNAQFGKVFAGYGSDRRYQAGGTLNFFNGNRRISVLGLSNNVNQQNFSSQDLLGLTGSGGQQGGGRGGAPGGGGQGPRPPGGNANDNFLTNQQGGISTTNSIGLNYTDSLGKKVGITASYFFNHSKNINAGSLRREYFMSGQEGQVYNEQNSAETRNVNHRFNVRLEYNIDSSNSLLITPRFSTQSNRAESSVSGANTLSELLPLSSTQNNNGSSNSGYSFSNNILFRHKFKTVGRTFSVGVGTDLNRRNGNSSLYSDNRFYNLTDSLQLLDQRANTNSDGFTLSPSVAYTEPVGKNGQLQFNYSPSFSNNNSEKDTRNLDPLTGQYDLQDSVLSNRFKNNVYVQRGGLSYRMKGQMFHFVLGANYQNVQLKSLQSFPMEQRVNKSFDKILPMAIFNYRFTRSTNLRLMYFTSTSNPSITQLQNVVNNSNPLFLSMGNPNLKQEYTNSIIARFNLTNNEKARTFMVFMNLRLTSDYIGTATAIASQDSLLPGDIVLRRGSQLSAPVNLSGYQNFRSFVTYGFPVKWIKSNVNLNGGFMYTKTPSLINNATNLAHTYNINGGVVLGSNISTKVDFTLSTTANYNIVDNSIRPGLNNNYYYQQSAARVNVLPWKGLVLSSDFNHMIYTGLGDFNQSIYLWNAGLGYKFLKKQAAELRLTVFDLLNQNKSINRTVNASYVEDTNIQVLTRYYMVTFTYNIRNYQTGATAPELEGGRPPRY
jgi:outer membrane receptor protein involved in Fe transport